MRVFGRFLYALIMVGFFLLAFTYSRDLMQTKYLEDVFGASLTDTDSEYPEFYYFYTSIPNYHKTEPIIFIDQSGYQIRGYEVLIAEINNDNQLVLTEAVYMIIYSGTEDLSQVGGMYLADDTDTNTKVILIQRFKTLNIINGINDEGTVYLAKDSFFENEYTRLVLINKSSETLVDAPFTLSESDFTIKDFVQTFYDDNGYLPTIDDLDGLSGNNIFPNKPHVADDYVYIFYIGMGIYFTVLIFMTYIIFFRKRRHY